MLNRIYLYAAGALSLILGAIGLYLKGRAQGTKEARIDALEDAVDNVHEAKEIDDEVDDTPAADVKRELFDDFGK